MTSQSIGLGVHCRTWPYPRSIYLLEPPERTLQKRYSWPLLPYLTIFPFVSSNLCRFAGKAVGCFCV